MIKYLLVLILLPSICFSQVGKGGGRIKVVGNKIYLDSSGVWVPIATESQASGGATWLGLPGKPETFPPSTHSHVQSDITSLVNDLAGKSATGHNHTANTLTGYQGYAINVQALTSSPADGATIYFGTLPKAPVSAAATSKIYIRKAGTLKIAEIYCYSGTAGSNESWSIYVRLNNTTETLIATVSTSASERVFTNSSLSIAVAAGDYIEIKCVNPTWGTNPLTTIFGGYIYIE